MYIHAEYVNQAASLGLMPELGAVVAGPVGMEPLWQLQGLMEAQGLKLQPTRMVYDRMYALERLATAHARGDAELQALAQSLFDRYQNSGEWLGLLH